MIILWKCFSNEEFSLLSVPFPFPVLLFPIPCINTLPLRMNGCTFALYLSSVFLTTVFHALHNSLRPTIKLSAFKACAYLSYCFSFVQQPITIF